VDFNLCFWKFGDETASDEEEADDRQGVNAQPEEEDPDQ